jgi:hypothetical protein
VEGVGHLPPEGLGLEGLPVIESRAVAEGEDREEIVVVDLCGLGEEGQAERAGLVGRVTMCAALSQEAAETEYVHRLDVAAIEPDRGAVRHQPCVLQGSSQE